VNGIENEGGDMIISGFQLVQSNKRKRKSKGIFNGDGGLP